MADSEEARLQDRLARREERSGRLHIETTAARNDLAKHLHHQGRLAEAEAQYTITCEGFAQHFGSAHLFTLSCLNNLAVVIRDRGRPQEALAILGVVHQARTQQLGPAHPLTLNAAMNFLDIQVQLGDLETALTEFRDLLATCEVALRPDDQNTVVVRNRLADVLRRTGRHEESARLVGPPEARPVGRVLLGCARVLRYAGMCPVAMTASRHGAELVLGVHDHARAQLVPGNRMHDAELGIRTQVVSPESLALPYRTDQAWLPVADRVADAVGAIGEHLGAVERELGRDRLRVQVRVHHQYWPQISAAPALAVDRRVMSRRARARHDQLVPGDFRNAALHPWWRRALGRTGFTGYLAAAPTVLVSSIHGVAGTARPSRYEV